MYATSTDVAHILLPFVLFSGGNAAPDVTFRLIFFQYLLDLQIERTVEAGQAFLQILVYGGLADTEFPGGAPDGRLVLYDVKRQLTGALLNMFPQDNTLHSALLQHLYAAAKGIMSGEE